MARLQAKRKEARERKQRHWKGVGQEEARESPRTPGSLRKCEGVNTHTPKATPILGEGVPVDSRNFRGRVEESNLNGLLRFLYH
jgi:hypothetical protein